MPFWGGGGGWGSPGATGLKVESGTAGRLAAGALRSNRDPVTITLSATTESAPTEGATTGDGGGGGGGGGGGPRRVRKSSDAPASSGAFSGTAASGVGTD